MNLLDSLLDAIVRLEGDALVMHVGEKPYVVTTAEASGQFRGPVSWGQVELSSRVLTMDAVLGMLAQILPVEQRVALDEYGAVEYSVASNANPREWFTIVAARGGDDIWLEVRRHPEPSRAAREEAVPPVSEAASQPAVAQAPEPSAMQSGAEIHADAEPKSGLGAFESEIPAVHAPELHAEQPAASGDAASSESFPALPLIEEEMPQPAHETVPEHPLLAADADWGDDVMTEGELGEILRASAAAIITGESTSGGELGVDDASAVASMEVVDSSIEIDDEAEEMEISLDAELGQASQPGTTDHVQDLGPAPVFTEAMASVPEPASSEQEHVWAPRGSAEVPETIDGVHDVSAEAGGDRAFEPEAVPTMNEGLPVPEPTSQPDSIETTVHSSGEPPLDEPVVIDTSGEESDTEPEVARIRPAIVVPLNRPSRPESQADLRAGMTSLDRVLRLAAGRGAAAVYVVAQSAPMLRVDGEFCVLEGEPAFSAALVERLTAEIVPHGRDDAGSASTEWTIDVPEIGRVRCTSFRDHRGPGLILRMVPQRAISADQLALSAEVQALCSEADGLVLVAGGRGSGKSTLLTSFVDLINRTRSDHVITAESQIDFLHENKRSFISQREVRGDAEAMAAAVRAACREDPDVLLIEDLRTPELATLALEAAQAGRLVFGSVPAPSALAAVERVIEMFPPERREKIQAQLAATLRGVVSQVLLRRMRGGRVAAREVLLNTPAVANLILEGKTFQLGAAIESGRRYGMMPLAESLASLVREGTVHPSHAYRKAPNREQFLAILRRDGVDTSVAERLA